jgi:hypothetical protein
VSSPRRLARTLAAVVTVGAVALIAAPAHAATQMQRRVSGYTTSECNAKGGKVVKKLQGEGYVVTFVGCHYDPDSSKGYVGTVFYHR